MKPLHDLFQSCLATLMGTILWVFSICGIGWHFGPTVALVYTVVTYCLLAAVGSSLERTE